MMASKTSESNAQTSGINQVVKQLSRKRIFQRKEQLLLEDAKKMFKDLEEITSRSARRSLRVAPKPTERLMMVPCAPRKSAAGSSAEHRGTGGEQNK